MAIEEHCGLFGLVAPSLSPGQQIEKSLVGASGVQNRGQQGAGIASRVRGETRVTKGDGLLKEIFTPDLIAQITPEESASWNMVHLRYGTSGGHTPENVQPFSAVSQDGAQIIVAHNGQFVATEHMRDLLREDIPNDASDTYLFTQLLAQTPGTPEEKLLRTLDNVDGAYSLLIGIDDELYATRDPRGIRPLILGKNGQGWMVASETHALDKVGAEIVREVNPGEVLKLTADGPIVIREGIQGQGNFCDFEWDYFARPETRFPIYEQPDDGMHPERWRNVLKTRIRCGEILAQEAPIPHADMIVGIPDSGVPLAAGYARAAGIPLMPAIIRDHFDKDGDKRLFQGDNDMAKIRGKVLGKLSFVQDPEMWEGKVIVFADDSQVRGSVSAELTQMAFDLGAKEVHWVFGFPMVMHSCHLGVSMRTESELIAARNNGDPVKIAEEIGATSVHFISHEGFIKSRRPNAVIRSPQDRRRIFLENGGCGGCLTGVYPVNNDGTTS